jgi:ATP phosphoribosyltransferase
MCLAAPTGFDLQAQLRRGSRLSVATKYVETTRRYFAQRGMHADLIKLYGSMELAPLVGLADVIVDLVSTGATLKANGLEAFETIAEVSSRLVVNQAALKLRFEELDPLVRAFAKAAV